MVFSRRTRVGTEADTPGQARGSPSTSLLGQPAQLVAALQKPTQTDSVFHLFPDSHPTSPQSPAARRRADIWRPGRASRLPLRWGWPATPRSHLVPGCRSQGVSKMPGGEVAEAGWRRNCPSRCFVGGELGEHLRSLAPLPAPAPGPRPNAAGTRDHGQRRQRDSIRENKCLCVDYGFLLPFAFAQCPAPTRQPVLLRADPALSDTRRIQRLRGAVRDTVVRS